MSGFLSYLREDLPQGIATGDLKISTQIVHSITLDVCG